MKREKQPSRFSQRLSQLRVLSGMYLKEIASYLHVSVGTMSNYENGIHQPNLETLCRLADFYGVTTDYLLGRDDVSLESETDAESDEVSLQRLRKLQSRILKMTPKELEILELVSNLILKHKITTDAL